VLKPNPRLRPISANLFRMFFPNSHKIVILSGAPSQICRVTPRLVARSRRTPRVLILSMPFVPFQTPVLVLGWLESSEQQRQDKHLRGPSTPRHQRCSHDKSVRRFAQDDDFVGVLKKNIPNKLALMGLRPGLSSAVPSGLFTRPTAPLGRPDDVFA